MHGFCDDWKRKCEQLKADYELVLKVAEEQVARLTYERDRARMMAESSGSLAEYRMRQIFALQAEISHLKGEAL